MRCCVANVLTLFTFTIFYLQNNLTAYQRIIAPPKKVI